MAEFLDKFSQINLGQSLLTIAVILGFFLTLAVVFRSIEIPLRIYLDKRKNKKSHPSQK